ncbi:MAG: hypothetical protein F4025_03255 [Synechococcus sp. SB0669_bin_7]|nr:hypothetical protein [Cyanobacteria bacterium MAG IRC3_bin_20]MYG64786.1 hypothetical protein [Synechococcus sp. SB0675_bin_7]MYK85435.1 hypothetical protein [Synechococcus sp. SB0669_bin_7]
MADEESGFAADLRGATTDMATEQVERLLRAVPDPKGWEIGEGVGGMCADERCCTRFAISWFSQIFLESPRSARGRNLNTTELGASQRLSPAKTPCLPDPEDSLPVIRIAEPRNGI